MVEGVAMGDIVSQEGAVVGDSVVVVVVVVVSIPAVSLPVLDASLLLVRLLLMLPTGSGVPPNSL